MLTLTNPRINWTVASCYLQQRLTEPEGSTISCYQIQQTNNKHQRRLIVSTVSETQQKQTKSILPAQLTEQQARNAAIYSKFKRVSQTLDCDQSITSVLIGKLQLLS